MDMRTFDQREQGGTDIFPEPVRFSEKPFAVIGTVNLRHYLPNPLMTHPALLAYPEASVAENIW